MVEYSVDIDNEEIMKQMRRWRREMPDFMRLLLSRFGSVLEAKAAKRSKSVLNVITGRLSSSMFHRVPNPDLLYIGAGTNVSYAAVHEFGFSGVQQVRTHTRTTVFGKKVDAFTVPAFSRRVNIPARPFVKPSIEEFFWAGESVRIAEGVFAAHKRRYGF